MTCSQDKLPQPRTGLLDFTPVCSTSKGPKVGASCSSAFTSQSVFFAPLAGLRRRRASFLTGTLGLTIRPERSAFFEVKFPKESRNQIISVSYLSLVKWERAKKQFSYACCCFAIGAGLYGTMVSGPGGPSFDGTQKKQPDRS